MAFEKKVESNYVVLNFGPEVRSADKAELTKALDSVIALEGYKALVIDFSSTRAIDDACLAEVVLKARALRKKDCKVYGLKIAQTILTVMMEKGLTAAIVPKKSLDEALLDSGVKTKPKPLVDVEFLNPIVEGVLKTFKIQAGVDCKPGIPYLKGAKPDMRIDITAVVGIISDRFNGSISVCFAEELFLKVVNQMLGESYKEINAENADAAGELLNIVFGQAKEVLNRKGYNVQKAIPTVIHGKDLNMKNMTNEPTLVLPVEASGLEFQIHINIPTGAKAAGF